MIWRQNIFIVGTLCLGCIAGAQVTNSSMTTADAFLCTGSTNYEGGADLTGLNFGAAGALVVAPASAASGESQSVIKFNLAGGVSQFNAAYGSNHWNITGITLELTSNYGVAGVPPNNPIFPVISGGQFVIEWLAGDDWVEGTGTPNLPTTDGVCYNSLPALLAPPREVLCTNTYSPPGNNVHIFWPLPLTTNLVADICGGGDVTFRFYAADNQIGYLFNSYKYGRGNEPLIHVVATSLLKILSGIFTNGGFHLTGIGNNNATYQIQASTNLAMTNWLTIGTATADGNGNILFNDSSATNALRFYRIRQ
jgi:hypothetical protein